MAELTIDGVVSTPDTVSQERFENEFLAWIDSKGYSFGGGIGPVVDDIDELVAMVSPSAMRTVQIMCKARDVAKSAVPVVLFLTETDKLWLKDELRRQFAEKYNIRIERWARFDRGMACAPEATDAYSPTWYATGY